MFEGVEDESTLIVLRIRMRDIQMKLKKGKRLTGVDEIWLRLELLGSKTGEFRDDEHRGTLLAQWWKEAQILTKRFKEEKEKKSKQK